MRRTSREVCTTEFLGRLARARLARVETRGMGARALVRAASRILLGRLLLLQLAGSCGFLSAHTALTGGGEATG
jgi:hypothetical protein